MKPTEGFMFTVMDYLGLLKLFIVLNDNGWLQTAFSVGRKMSCKCKEEEQATLLELEYS